MSRGGTHTYSGSCGGAASITRGLTTIMTSYDRQAFILPNDHGFFENPAQVFGASGAGRKPSDTVLRHSAFDEGRDVAGSIAEFPESVGHPQVVHECDDLVREDLAG